MYRLLVVSHLLPLGTLLLIGSFVTTSLGAEPSGYETEVAPLFKTYCLHCHDEATQEGEFRLDTMERDFTDLPSAQRWGEVRFRINNSEMPPKGEPQPSSEELTKAIQWISNRIAEGEAARMAKRGPVTHNRLSREEYGYTVYDLLGVHFDVYEPGTFNEDPRWHGFERIGSMLSLSPSHIDRYFKAAETVLDRAFPQSPPKTSKEVADAILMRHRDHRQKLEERGIADQIRAVVWPGGSAEGLRPFWWGHLKEPGMYRARIQLSGLKGMEGRIPHLSVWHHGQKRSIFDADVLAAEDEPVIIEFETYLSMPVTLDLRNEVPTTFNFEGNHTLNVLNGGGSIFTNSREVNRLNPTGYKLFDDEGGAIYPTLLIDWIEWEGPLTTDAERDKRKGFFPEQEGDLAEAKASLLRFATRAWRRPVSDDEISRYLKVIELELAEGEEFSSAYRAAMVGILTSKNFYYLEEGSATERRDHVDDWELASRLSYFLWSSMPDEELAAVAESGHLRDPQQLRAQLARVLSDPKIERFSDSFPKQWLQLYRVGMFPPDNKLFPDYDMWLEKSMVLESQHFFEEVFSKNLSLREFLHSDWTMANPRLAAHYQLATPQETGFQRVPLRPEDHRGGLLTQASILSLTSDGTRHRPVHRGVWVSEAIFGRTPPPPPPNVEPLEPTPSDKPKATIRMQLEAHATHATCASCHQGIDPLGFAFENFDAIGRWRETEVVTGGQGDDPKVDATGQLADGRAYDGPDQFKQLLVEDLDRFAEAFVEQLATYALRRAMTIDDTDAIRQIAEASKKDDYKLQSVIENLVLSDLFLKR